MTRLEKIRSMSDWELVTAIYKISDAETVPFCHSTCHLVDYFDDIIEEERMNCLYSYLLQEAEEDDNG